MEFRDVVRRRRMVRRYRPDRVDPAALERILDTARRGPSAGFAQGQYIVVVTAAATRARLAALCAEPEHVAAGLEPWLSTAPVHLVVCTRPESYRQRYAEPDKAMGPGPEAWNAPFWWVDAGATLMLVLLAAVDNGLAAGFLRVGDVAGVRALLGIPEDVEVVGVVTVGHPAPDRRSGSLARGRRPAGQVIRRERWTGAGPEGAAGTGAETPTTGGADESTP